MLNKLFTLLIGLALLTSCQQFHNGRYIVYKVDENNRIMHNYLSNSNDTVCRMLKENLMGNRYDISFTDKYARLKNLKSGTEVLLSKSRMKEQVTFSKSREVDIYEGENAQGPINSKSLLRYDDEGTLVYVVELHIPQQMPLVVPAQFGGQMQSPTGDKAGRVVCYLNKEDE